MRRREYIWCVKFPSDAYAFNIYVTENNERAARAEARRFFGYKRLPPGTEFWRA